MLSKYIYFETGYKTKICETCFRPRLHLPWNSTCNFLNFRKSMNQDLTKIMSLKQLKNKFYRISWTLYAEIKRFMNVMIIIIHVLGFPRRWLSQSYVCTMCTSVQQSVHFQANVRKIRQYFKTVFVPWVSGKWTIF